MFWIVLFIILLFIFKKCFKNYRIYEQSIIAYSGTVGSGKTYLGVGKSRGAYFRQKKHYKRGKSKFYGWLYRFFVPDSKYAPSLYSTIPILLEKGVWSKPLKKEHLLMEERLPQKCVIFIDEVGAFASQWEFDNPRVQEQLQFFLRYFRQFLDGKMILTDQSVGRICKPIRELIGRVYWLHDFHRKWFILPIYQVFVLPLMMVEDSVTRLDDGLVQAGDGTRCLFGFLPYKWMKFLKRYDSRCFSVLYDGPAVREINEYTSFKSRYLIDITVPDSVKKAYKQHKDIYHNWIYSERFVNSSLRPQA